MNQVALIADRAMQKLAISFEVAGEPLPQGSKFAQVIGKGKSQRVILTDMADKATKTRKSGSLKRWKELIGVKADAQARGDLLGPVHLWRGAIILECEFVMPRSDSHYKKRKGVITSELNRDAPTIPTKDLDKLIRAVGDALSKVVYWDDVQVIGFGESTKRFAKTRDAVGGVRVKVRQV